MKLFKVGAPSIHTSLKLILADKKKKQKKKKTKITNTKFTSLKNTVGVSLYW